MKKLIILLPFVTFLVACRNEAPNCSGQETVKLVKQIAQDKFLKEDLEIINIKMEVMNIRTLDKNSNTGAYSCAADLNVTFNNRNRSISITCTSELLDDKKKFYVTVYGG